MQNDVENRSETSRTFRKDSAFRKTSFTLPDLIVTANKIVFHLNKAALRIRHNRATKHVQHRQLEVDEDSFNRSNDLSLHLSSVESPCSGRSSSPSGSIISQKFCIPTVKITDLPDAALVNIARFLDAKTVRSLAQTCSKIRNALISSSNQLERQVVSRFEIIIAYNNEIGAVDVRALKRNRSVRDEVFSGRTLADVIPKFVHCMAKITFGHGVNVFDYRQTLLKLHSQQQLTPLAFTFSGGSLSKGNLTCCGADLRSFSETEFIYFIAHFFPHVQEVQLLTTRLFKTSTSPARLLSFVPLLSSFGISFERPVVKYYFDDVKQVVSYWRHDPLSRSCSVFMRSPRKSCLMKWLDVGGQVKGCTSGNHHVDVPHMFLENVTLSFHLH